MSKDLTWPTDRMAKVIDVTPRRLQQLVQEGIVPKSERGKYNPVAVNLAYIRFLRDRIQSPDASSSDYMAEKLRKTRAERELLEMELAKERNEVISAQRVYELLENIFLAIRSKIVGSHLSEAEQNAILLDLAGLKDAQL